MAPPGGPGAVSARKGTAVESDRDSAEWTASVYSRAAEASSGDKISDDWLRDEWWRATNPGASAARGVLWAAAAAVLMWPALIAAGYGVWSLFG